MDTLERLYLSAGLGTSCVPPGGVGGSGWGEECLNLAAQTVCTAAENETKGKHKELTANFICMLGPHYVKTVIFLSLDVYDIKCLHL